MRFTVERSCCCRPAAAAIKMTQCRKTRLIFASCVLSICASVLLSVYHYFYYVDLGSFKTLTAIMDADVPPQLPNLDPFAPEFTDFLTFSGDPVVRCNGGEIREEPWVKVVNGNDIVFSVPSGVNGHVECQVEELKTWPAPNATDVSKNPGFWKSNTMRGHVDDAYGRSDLKARLKLRKSDFAFVTCNVKQEPDSNVAADGWQGFISGIHVADTFNKNNPNNGQGKTSPVDVLVFIVDAVSRFTAENAMPQTMNYLRGQLGAAIFEHHTIVGENSLPNAVALLTGKKLNDLPAWVKHGALLDYPMIWKEFSKKGYVTAYMEDWTQTFRDDLQMYAGSPLPTDHIAVMFGHYSKKFRSDNCIMRQPAHELYVNLPEAMWSAYPANQPKFFAGWFNQYSHSDVSCAAYLDAPLANMLASMHSKGFLDNTLTIIMGDHGNRYMKWFRGTTAGRYDHRTPFLAVVPPLRNQSSIPRGNPPGWLNVWKNVDKLTSHLDIHATLVDLLNAAYHHSNKNGSSASAMNRDGYSGRSLLTQIPTSRTCKDAGISTMYCPYIDWSSNALPWGIANSLGQHFVDFLNEYKRDYFARHGVKEIPCVPTTLKRTQNAGVLDPGRFFLVLFVNSDIFEGMEFEASGTYKRNFEHVQFSMQDVARLDKFGDPPKCLRNMPEEAEKKTIEFLCECASAGSNNQKAAPRGIVNIFTVVFSCWLILACLSVDWAKLLLQV